MPGNVWQNIFDNHAPYYHENVFTMATIAEVDFIEKRFGLNTPVDVLDIGCGTGRHSIELAKRGHKVTGVDLSQGMLDQAAQNAQSAGVEITLIQADATLYSDDSNFDLATCLCEGAFCLIGNREDPCEHDKKILENISRSLKRGGHFILTALNAMKMIRQYSYDDINAGRFDPLTQTERSSIEIKTAEGLKKYEVTEHGYMPGELAALCRVAGLQVDNIWGGTAGNWGERPVDPDEYEIMIIAYKPEAKE